MEVYANTISMAFYTFPAAAALFTLPFLLTQYRRHGYIHKYRALMLYLLLLYLMNAVYLILLPLPPTIHNEPPDADSYVQWVPFHFIRDIASETAVRADAPSTYWRLLREQAFLQVAFNILLTVPLGMFLRLYFRRSWLACLLLALGLSLLFEITQVTGIYGIYDYPYRLFDVDDLIANTAGGLLGFLTAAWLTKRLPRIDRLDDNVDLATKRVSYTRRAVAFLCDWTIALPIWVVLGVLHVPLPYWMTVAIYFILIPLVTNGRTFGKWLVRIQLRGKADRIMTRELVIRYGLLYGVIGGLHEAFLLMAAARSPAILLLPAAMALFALDAVLAIHALRCVFNRSRQLFYEKRSRTHHVIR
ncbi:VanZ family protein [Paenibacillus methanolicus]|uniref:Glycopeptide antibiotics resistance protein n=1 Tax=Paenibacillus methanolicus TaxID=582686 RepID=A0A5S5CAK2_9BACL|nr:VanZ family protein [Paenibacillus methanolicus]TYP76431.1 glycopeptide antibiotics resistance protein [Paenibacillus methanolicus]